MLTLMPHSLNKTPTLKQRRPGPILIRRQSPGDATINRFHVKHNSNN
jgi:hypothetical protein